MIKNLKKKKTMTIRKYVRLTFITNGKRETVKISDSSFTFNKSLKTVIADDTDITDKEEFRNISKEDCYGFLKSYLKQEGIDLILQSTKPCKDYPYSRRYEFEKEQDIIKQIKKMNIFENMKYISSSSVFDIGNGYETDINTVYPEMISNDVTYQISDDRSLELSIIHEIVCE